MYLAHPRLERGSTLTWQSSCTTTADMLFPQNNNPDCMITFSPCLFPRCKHLGLIFSGYREDKSVTRPPPAKPNRKAERYASRNRVFSQQLRNTIRLHTATPGRKIDFAAVI